ncbi:MAG: DUF222 domain-containing protein [Candidatus Microthrix sp.]|jgi:hypothetical protein|uniref:HNH nuclease domain-containing protein n=1 Tax=Candidatus Neomicrothrix parvicella RN1 TaxID=1229780 RepID=R4Z5V6_9ACTN|nr:MULTISPECIES: HNH endonuclease signature motif containing protein [Microthrix]MBK7019909.1 DUF222 domain-containing protein [Candidatus Microthrix sp.]MBL0203179.1 DUF222 domain-containing protein [Candidatus Microthrix sp.]MBP7406198.1 DUF222 domain-containing protein [Candidatus Microthrix sp.]MBP7854193.1 DUF222 domain-containing protein [Candidatus Microthrix sp.]MBP7989025.1 DUF222 domain-containing protein [Candidatus Microthrix sp.]
MFDEAESTKGDGTPADRSRADTDHSTALTAPMAEVVELATLRHRIDVREAKLLADLDATGDTIAYAGHLTGPWLANSTGIGRADARRRVRVAAELRAHHPRIAEAFKDARLGWHHAAAWSRHVTPLLRALIDGYIDPLVDLAQVATYDRWVQELRGVCDLLNQDGNHDPLGDAGRNRLHLNELPGGVTRLSGEFVGELALKLRAHLEAVTDELMLQYHRASEEAGGDLTVAPSRPQARAEGLVELCERAAGVDLDATKAPEPEVVVHFNADSGELRDTHNERLDPRLMRWLITAAVIRPLETSGNGDALRMGRAIRYANRHMRRALTVRDGGCIFPGCDRPASWCDAHHVDVWDNGGPTDIDNLALVCRFHHRLTHRPGWTMRRRQLPDDPSLVLFEWQTPYGHTVHSQRCGVRTGAPPEVSAA